MNIGEKVRITPWQTGLISTARVEAYRQAIAPLQERLAAAKLTRQGVFRWLKAGGSSLVN
jgi:hypothetical protein